MCNDQALSPSTARREWRFWVILRSATVSVAVSQTPFPFSFGPIFLAALKQALLSALVLPSIFPAHWILNELQNVLAEIH